VKGEKGPFMMKRYLTIVFSLTPLYFGKDAYESAKEKYGGNECKE
jgi:hypothetical protein